MQETQISIEFRRHLQEQRQKEQTQGIQNEAAEGGAVENQNPNNQEGQGQQEENKQDGDKKDKKDSKSKRWKKKKKAPLPRFKFHAEHLIDKKKGIKLYYNSVNQMKCLKKTDTNEVDALNEICDLYKDWHFKLVPKLSLDYFKHKCVTLGREDAVKAYMSQVRNIHIGKNKFEDFEEPDIDPTKIPAQQANPQQPPRPGVNLPITQQIPLSDLSQVPDNLSQFPNSTIGQQLSEQPTEELSREAHRNYLLQKYSGSAQKAQTQQQQLMQQFKQRQQQQQQQSLQKQKANLIPENQPIPTSNNNTNDNNNNNQAQTPAAAEMINEQEELEIDELIEQSYNQNKPQQRVVEEELSIGDLGLDPNQFDPEDDYNAYDQFPPYPEDEEDQEINMQQKGQLKGEQQQQQQTQQNEQQGIEGEQLLNSNNYGQEDTSSLFSKLNKFTGGISVDTNNRLPQNNNQGAVNLDLTDIIPEDNSNQEVIIPKQEILVENHSNSTVIVKQNQSNTNSQQKVDQQQEQNYVEAMRLEENSNNNSLSQPTGTRNFTRDDDSYMPSPNIVEVGDEESNQDDKESPKQVRTSQQVKEEGGNQESVNVKLENPNLY